MITQTIVDEDLQRIYQSVKENRCFYDATILITGCAGFLGFYFTHYFLHYGENLGIKRVIGLDNFLLGKPQWITKLCRNYPELFYLKSFDISNDHIEKIEGAKEANYIIHAASIASPTFYRQYPLETIDANIWGLRRLLDSYNGSNFLRGFLFLSSSEIYGDPDPDYIPTNEEYRGYVTCTGPRSCYDESKRFGETLCYVYAKSYGMPITIARPFNNYGPGMHLGDSRLPADLAKCILEMSDIILLSDGSPTRTFCYITDAIGGYLKCLLYGKYDYFNIGIDKPEIKVSKLAEIFCSVGNELFGYTGKIYYENSSDPEYLKDNPNRRCPDILKARNKLGYDPKVGVEEGVRRYLQFLSKENN